MFKLTVCAFFIRLVAAFAAVVRTSTVFTGGLDLITLRRGVSVPLAFKTLHCILVQLNPAPGHSKENRPIFKFLEDARRRLKYSVGGALPSRARLMAYDQALDVVLRKLQLWILLHYSVGYFFATDVVIDIVNYYSGLPGPNRPDVRNPI